LRNVFVLNRSLENDDISVEEAVEAKEFIEFSDITSNDARNQSLSNTDQESNGLISRSTTFTNDDSLLSQVTAQSSPHSLESTESDNINPNLNDPSEPSQVLLPPIWVPDELVSVCTLCCLQFTIIRRRHHCRNCGQIYCNNCSNHFIPLACYGYDKPVRVCNPCHQQIHQLSISET